MFIIQCSIYVYFIKSGEAKMDTQRAAAEALKLIKRKQLDAAVSFIRDIHNKGLTFGRFSQQIGVALLCAFP